MKSKLCKASKNKTDVIDLSLKIKRPLRERKWQVYKNAINHRGNRTNNVVNNFDQLLSSIYEFPTACFHKFIDLF